MKNYPVLPKMNYLQIVNTIFENRFRMSHFKSLKAKQDDKLFSIDN